MDLILFVAGLLGLLIFIIVLIKDIIKKRSKRRALIGLGVCFVMVVVGLFMPTSGTKTDKGIKETDATKTGEEKENDTKPIEEEIAEKIDKSISDTYKGDNYSVIVEESSSPNRFNVEITLDEERFLEGAWAGASAISILDSIKSYAPDVDDKVDNYGFIFYADGEKQYAANFINDNIDDVIKIALVDGDGTELPEKDYDEYMKDTKDTKLGKKLEFERKSYIEKSIKDRVQDEYHSVSIEKITINDDMGKDEEGYYIALIKLVFEAKNRRKTANEMMRMYSDDLVATLASKGIDDISRAVVFWKDGYNNRQLKYSYNFKDGKFYITDIMGE